jgi:hypothetical protein
VTKTEVVDLLTRTSTNNRTGLIGGPYSVTGYTLTGALAIVERCEQFERVRHRSHDAICGWLAGHGAHIWYLRLDPPKEDPWNAV